MNYPFEKKYNEKQIEATSQEFIREWEKEFGGQASSSLEFVKIFD